MLEKMCTIIKFIEHNKEIETKNMVKGPSVQKNLSVIKLNNMYI